MRIIDRICKHSKNEGVYNDSYENDCDFLFGNFVHFYILN